VSNIRKYSKLTGIIRLDHFFEVLTGHEKDSVKSTYYIFLLPQEFINVEDGFCTPIN
jgi:hypothetical protein